MRGHVLAFEPRAGGTYRMVLEYEDTSISGKTEANADAFDGRFVELVPGERVVEEILFRSDDPGFASPMRMVTALEHTAEGTLVTITASDVPDAIRPQDHRAGMDSALANLAAYVERAPSAG